MATTVYAVGDFVGESLRALLRQAGMSERAAVASTPGGNKLDVLALAQESVGIVQFRSRLLPPVTVRVGGPPSTDGGATSFLRMLQPALEVRSPFGRYVVAPYGDPGPTGFRRAFWWGLLGIGAIGGLATWGLLKLGRKGCSCPTN